MDPASIVAAVVIGTILGAPIIKNVAALAINGYEKGKIKKEKRLRVKHARRYHKDEEYRKQVDKKRAMVQALNRSNVVSFQTLQGDKKYDIEVNTVTEFDKEKEIIIPGHLCYMDSVGKMHEVPIYLFQPRCVTSDGKSVGPFLTKKGRLQDKKPYVAKIPGTGELVRGYIPKREIVTGMNFDFVSASANFQDAGLSNYLYIKTKRDENGNYIPLDFNDEHQVNGLKRYMQAHKDKDAATQYFSGIYETAVFASKKFAVKTAVAYRISKPTAQTAETETKQTEDPYDFYERYNYYQDGILGVRGTEIDRNDDIVAHAMGIDPTPPSPGRRR